MVGPELEIKVGQGKERGSKILKDIIVEEENNNDKTSKTKKGR
ncbi:hypothetical protein F3D3_3128 [Fusibacter sp. 3D3]|nr:hypothetical protein F3D3_3128 [Fusibacter sp. 3D3]